VVQSSGDDVWEMTCLIRGVAFAERAVADVVLRRGDSVSRALWPRRAAASGRSRDALDGGLAADDAGTRHWFQRLVPVRWLPTATTCVPWG